MAVLRREAPTGGNWKKSPESTTCRPPKGRESLRMMRQTSSTMSNSHACIIEISSITSTSVDLICLRRRVRIVLMSESVSESATPMPLHA